MTLKQLIPITAIGIILAGCSESSDKEMPHANPGDEVKFGASIDEAASRTAYGEQIGNALRVNWLNGDLIQVASPQAFPGFRTAIYSVSNSSNNLDYAETIAPVGLPLLWGHEPEAKFYASYSVKDSYIHIDGDKVTSRVYFQATQCFRNPENTDASPLDLIPDAEAMTNLFMYAQTTAPRGSNVRLRFYPASSALWFKMAGFESQDSDEPIVIYGFNLSAPYDVKLHGGTVIHFNPDAVTPPTMTHEDNGGNYIELILRDSQRPVLAVKPGQRLSLKVLIPPTVKSVGQGWSLRMWTNRGTFRMDLTGDHPLQRGYIHIVNLKAIRL